ncbi:hypothetical protein J8273_2154 [Carpediemonas membranifera]|uniref:Uncharacterized protein n=1 Tax=Carpediemonas membranifera TaxID=201153 RepID=A0A8J6B621_9EUKA|nr:hypothetical protein J8273_2154 [Carpediemonas membranifera]|eukprot:KAG9396423.1 hypothetical protein J8273_2154 [Carpediemonas membranifera]
MAAQTQCTDTKQTLIDAFRCAVIATAHVPGDVPSKLAKALEIEFGESIPKLDDLCKESSDDISKLKAQLSSLKLTSSKATTMLDRAQAILSDGPRLSMNIELCAGETLPEQVYTLLQGTLYAVLLHAGADPDLDDKEDDEERVTEHRKHYPAEAKSMWFLCKKTFFTRNVAEKDGKLHIRCRFDDAVLFRRYHGRLYTRGNNAWNLLGYKGRDTTAYRMVRLPPVLSMRSTQFAAIAVTPRGLYGWGSDHGRVLGMYSCKSGGGTIGFPRRIRFVQEPQVAQYEASLPAWAKDRLVTCLAVTHNYSVLITPVGVVASGYDSKHFLPGEQRHSAGLFQRVPLPRAFYPTHVLAANVAVLTDGSNQMISGENSRGQLGMGHCDEVQEFVPLPFHVDRVISVPSVFSLYQSGKQLLFAGRVMPFMLPFLPHFAEDDECSRATPLTLPHRVKAVFLSTFIAFVRADGEGVFMVDALQHYYELPFEPTMLLVVSDTFFFRNKGAWFAVGNNEYGAVSPDITTDWIDTPLEVSLATVESLRQMSGFVIEYPTMLAQ